MTQPLNPLNPQPGERLGERVTSFTKDSNANFSSEKWQNEEFRGVYILRIREKTLSQIS